MISQMPKTFLVNCILNFFLIGFASTPILFLNSCTRPQPKSNVTPKWIKIAVPTSPAPSDWNFCTTDPCFQNAALVMEGLVKRLGPEGENKIIANLAESWVATDKNTLKLSLKKEVFWTNHLRFNSADVVEAWKKVLSSKNEEAAKYLFPIVNARNYFQGKISFDRVGIDATSPHTIDLKLNVPPSDFLENLAHPSTWPISSASKDNLVTLGPFLHQGDKNPGPSRYVRNPNYFGPRPPLDGIAWNSVPNSKLRVNQYADKEVEVALQIPSEYWRLSQPDIALKSGFRSVGIYFNRTKRPLHLPKLRKALMEAIDFSEWRGLLRLPVSLALNLPVFNPVEAQSELTAFRLDDKTLHYLENESLHSYQRITLAYVNGEQSEEIANNIQAQWLKHLNIRVEIQPISRVEMLKTLTPPPSILLQPVTPHATENLLAWDAHPVAPEQSSLLWFPLYSQAQIILQSTRVKELNPNPIGGWDFNNVGLEG